MKVSESWLREWVNPELTTQELADQITMAGLEVDAIEAVAQPLSGVVVGQIMSVEQHPDADKLRVCQVAGNGDDLLQVVCGAPNAREGIKIPFATIGAVLPGDFKIKKAKLRGVESFGMLCAQTELQLGEDDDGLWELPEDAPVGKEITHYLSLNDQCIEVDLTPNRSDCLSIKGIARDVGVLNRLDVVEPEIVSVPATIDDTFSIELHAADMCPRYVGRVIRNVDVSKPTPLWMQERLRRAGLNTKDILVDVTNYVLLELGQPMHAFDLEKLSNGIVVRKANTGESIALLNGQTVELDSETLVIADHEKAVAMAGIMGGADTAVSSTTQHILLESAFFVPTAIAGRARSYGLHTDSSHRFERGVDHQLQEQAIERATQLIMSVAGGEAGPINSVEKTHEIMTTRKVILRKARIESGLGFALADDEVVDILQRLGLGLIESNEDGWVFDVPSYRFDISIEADLLEELARIYGYNNLPTSQVSMQLDLPQNTETQVSLSTIQQQLVARDYQEAVCYSFVDPELQQAFDPEITPIPLKNPISADMAVMRTSLWPGLIKALKHNINRQQQRVRLFETGLRFVPSTDSSLASDTINLDLLKQQAMVAGLIYGDRQNESWSSENTVVDFYDLKGDVESIVELTGQAAHIQFAKGEHPALHPGQTANLLLDGQVIGTLGRIHPQLQQKLDLPQAVYLFEIDQEALLQAQVPHFEPLSRFPEVRRDLAIIVDQDVTVNDLIAVIRDQAGENLVNLKVFDVYIGKGIDSHRKSVALGLTFQHISRTLTDEEITQSIDAVIKAMTEQYEAQLR